jgi:hypothetical protein
VIGDEAPRQRDVGALIACAAGGREVEEARFRLERAAVEVRAQRIP